MLSSSRSDVEGGKPTARVGQVLLPPRPLRPELDTGGVGALPMPSCRITTCELVPCSFSKKTGETRKPLREPHPRQHFLNTLPQALLQRVYGANAQTMFPQESWELESAQNVCLHVDVTDGTCS